MSVAENTSPRSEIFDDIYFSPDDGLAETRHVFLQHNNLPAAWKDKAQFHIAELGFGTGLNFLAACSLFLQSCKPDQHLVYSSIEKYPLSAAEIERALNHWRAEFGDLLGRMTQALPLRISGTHPILLHPQITLILHYGDVTENLPRLMGSVDCWFLDGFAPAKNPDMWGEALYQAMATKSAPQASFATFTAAGSVKRGLQEAGFAVEKVRGYGRKREMLCGQLTAPALPVQKRKTQRVAVIGGGISGAAAAYFLQHYGVAVTLFDSAGQLASAASGNPRGLYNPRFSKNWSDEAHTYASAYALAHRIYKSLPAVNFTSCGNLHLINDDEKAARFGGFVANWGWHTDHAHLLDAQSASDIAGVKLAHSALYLPDGGMLAPPNACQALTRNVKLQLNSPCRVIRTASGWQVDGIDFDAVILANSAGVNDILAQISAPLLDIQTVRGQISTASASPLSQTLRCNVQYGGYLSACYQENGLSQHTLGATFQPWLKETDTRQEDHDYVHNKLAEMLPELAQGLTITAGRASLRTASPQRRPIVRQLDDGLYVSTAHGSHGLVTGLWGGWQLASGLIFSFAELT